MHVLGHKYIYICDKYIYIRDKYIYIRDKYIYIFVTNIYIFVANTFKNKKFSVYICEEYIFFSYILEKCNRCKLHW